MSLKNLTMSADVEQVTDTLGGRTLLDSGVYEASIKLAFMKPSKAGALGIELLFAIGDQELRETIYVTNRNGENFYVRDGKKHYLPGFITVNDMAQLGLGKQLAELDTETKLVKLYDYEQQAEVPKEVDVIGELIGVKLKLGITRVKEYKNQKGDDGNYHPIDEVREYNSVHKVFDMDGFTGVERTKKAESAEFIEQWLDKYQNEIVDKTKGVTPGAGEKKKEVKSLFS